MRFAPRIPHHASASASIRSPSRPRAAAVEPLEGRQLLALVNPSFEQALTGWTFDRAGGAIRNSLQNFETGLRAQHGNFFAELSSGSNGPAVGQYTTIANTFEAQAGDTISGYAFFKTRAFGPNPGSGDSYVAIKTGFGDTVATLFDAGADTLGPNGQTGWTYFEYTFDTAGVYKIEGGVANLAPNGLPSFLGLDNVQFSGGDAAPGTTTPVVDAGGPYVINEGQGLTVTARGYDLDDDVITYRWDVNRDGRVDATGRTVTFDAARLQGLGVGDGTQTYTIAVEADDGRGHRSTDTAALEVTNLPPVINDGSVRFPTSSPEGRPLSANLVASDPAGFADPVRVEWEVTKDGEVVRPRGPGGNNASGSLFIYTPEDDGTYVVTAHALDGDGGESSITRTVTVTNVAPTITALEGPATGVRGQERQFSAAFADAGAGDTHAATWTVTDGSGEVATGSGTDFAFTPAEAGSYEVVFTVADEDGGTATTSQTLTVGVVEVQADPSDPSRSLLAVGGSTGDDRIELLPGAEAGSVEVLIDDVSQGTFAGVAGVLVFGQAGDDKVHVHDIAVPVTFDGGAGDDKLQTGGFSDVLIGGEGDDKVVGRGPVEKQG